MTHRLIPRTHRFHKPDIANNLSDMVRRLFHKACICKLPLIILLTMVLAASASIPVKAEPLLELTGEERAWLDQNREKLTLWYNTEFPPIEFFSGTGTFIGIGADVLALVEDRLGVAFIRQPSDDWNAHLAALESGACAVAPTIVATPERERYAFFTRPYTTVPVVIITGNGIRQHATLDDLAGYRVAVVSGYATETYLRNRPNNPFEIVPMPDVAHALRATSFGQVDVFVENLAVAAYSIDKEGIPNLRVAGNTDYAFAFSIGVSRKYPLLFSAVNKALASIPPEDLEAIRKRWISLEVDPGLSPERIRFLVTVIVFITLLAIGLLGITYILRNRLNEKVAKLESAQKKLLDQAELLHLATEVAQAGIWDFRVASNIARLSPQWFAMLGYEPEGKEITYDELKKYIHPDDLPILEKKFTNYIIGSGHGLFETEIRFRKADGDWSWILSKGKAVEWNDKGVALRVIGLDTNIQSLKEVQENVAQSEAKFRAIFENAPYAIVINRLEDGRMLEANKAFLKSRGIDPSELRQVQPTGFSRIDESEAAAIVDQIAKTGGVENYETEIVGKDGAPRHITFSSVLMEVHGEKQILSMTIDITEQKRAAQAIKQSEARFRALFRNAPIPLANMTLEGVITEVNDTFVKILGYSLEDIPDLDHWFLHAYPDPEYRKQVSSSWEAAYRQAIDSENRIGPDEYRVTRKDGTVLTMVIGANVIDDALIVSLFDITALREKESAYHESMELLRATFNATNDGILVVDKDLNVIQSNRQFYEMWHIPPDLQKMDDDTALREFVQDQLADPAGFRNMVNTLYHSQREDMYEIAFKDGRVFECYTAPMILAEKEIGRVWDFRDITMRKKAEEAVDFERRQLVSIFDNLDEIIYVSDPVTYEMIFANRRLRELIGKDPKGKLCYEILQGLDQPCDFCTNPIIISNNRRPHRWEHRNLVSNIDLAIVDQLIRWPDGRDVRLEFAMDVSERKQAQERLRESEDKFSKIFKMAPNIIAITRMSDGKLLDVNEGYTEITGWERNEALGRSTKSDLPFWVDLSQRTRMVEDLKAGKDVLNREIEFWHKDGSVRIGQYSARAISLSDEQTLIFVLQDITEQRKLENERERLQEQLLQSQKMEAIGTLAGGVAHDFNNMLGVILGYSEMALDKLDANNPLYPDLEQILLAGKRSKDITRQLLAFSRQQTIAPNVLDLNEIVESMLKMIRRLIGEDIDLAWHPAARLWPIYLDPSQLDQILVNLCVNARDAIADVGTIAIETDNKTFDESSCSTNLDCRPGDYVMLSVSDNGCGMEKETLEHVFEPFFTTKAVGQGTGLGLATVYGITKQNKGFINVYSEPDQGTSFKIYLPRQAAVGDLAGTAEDEALPRSRGETILLVEDEQHFLRMTTRMLEGLGYTVLAANAPSEGLNIAKQQGASIHLLLTDVVMPGMNGRELATRLKGIYPGFKILFMSGYTANIIASRGALDETGNFIQKPFSKKDLAVKVRDVLDAMDK